MKCICLFYLKNLYQVTHELLKHSMVLRKYFLNLNYVHKLIEKTKFMNSCCEK